jgi:hypothetical protein
MSGQLSPSGSRSISVARRECANAGASARFMMKASSIGQPYSRQHHVALAQSVA